MLSRVQPRLDKVKYRLEDEMISDYVAKKQAEGDTRPMQEIATEYNDTVIYPDKVRLNCYYYRHYSFVKDIEMIFAMVLGRKVKFAGEEFWVCLCADLDAFGIR